MAKAVVTCTWNDVPHIGEQDKADMLASYPPHQRDARSKGIPALAAGAIYPVPEEEITVKPFKLPAWWPKVYGLDVGWRVTAAVFAAHDRETDIVYIYSEHYREQAEPSVHAAGIRARGPWIPGVVDPAARGRMQTDGKQLSDLYRDLGLNLTPAKTAVESGLQTVLERLSTGRLKVFSTCQHFFEEYRLYRRDERGAIVKRNDHCMDAMKMLVVSGLKLAKVGPVSIRRRIQGPADGVGY